MFSKVSKSLTRVTRPERRRLFVRMFRHKVQAGNVSNQSRRLLLLDISKLLVLIPPFLDVNRRPVLGEQELELPKYGEAGPFQAIKLPRLKHTYTTCSTSADRCTLKINAWVPRRSSAVDLKPPYPLVIITPGFLIGADQYNSYAERLASWGYVVISYDFVQQALDPTTDIDCVNLLEELIGWCQSSELLGKISDSENILLVGHSRGAKISTLASINDRRVKSLFLLDPVDVTVYTPPDRSLYPSATTALSVAKPLPLCIIGAGRGEDCAPRESNYDLYFKSARGPTWKIVVEDSGHLQFLDARNATAMGAFCQAGNSPDGQIENLAQSVMVAWAEMSLLRRADTGDTIYRLMRDSATGDISVCQSCMGNHEQGNSMVSVDTSIIDMINQSPVNAHFQSKNILFSPSL